MHTTHASAHTFLSSLAVALLLTACAVDEPSAVARCDTGWAHEGDVHSAQGLDVLAGHAKVRGNLYVDGADAGELAHLGCLQSIEGDLVLVNLPDAVDLTALGALTDVWGTITIAHNPALETLAGLDQLWLAGEIDITGNPSLRDVAGLHELTSISGLEIVDNDALLDLSGLVHLERAGAVVVSGNDSLPAVRLASLELIAETLEISSNARLAELAMPGLRTLGGPLAIEWNPALPSCRAEAIANQLLDAGFTGAISIRGNDDTGRCGVPTARSLTTR